MVVVSLSILPHGCIILDPNLTNLPLSAIELHKACNIACSNLFQTNPDVMILLSPHAISLSNSIGIYMNDCIGGTAEWNGAWNEFCFSSSNDTQLQCDVTLANDLFNYLKSDGVAVESIISFGKGCCSPLGWGEVVPLWFYEQQIKRNNHNNKLKYVIISWPQARFDPISYTSIAYDIGKHLLRFSNDQPKRISLLFSGDLSHVHDYPLTLQSHTLFQSPINLGSNDNIAKLFDSFIVDWVKSLIANNNNNEINLREAKELLFSAAGDIVVEAKTCGWSAFCAFQGCIEELHQLHQFFQSQLSNNMNENNHWNGTLHGYECPSYYGMMVVTFTSNK
eukprot:gene8261-11180_t